jgi:2,5-diamino-6-(ribosylamino)-4(3H)-pyrimidinone 5'-phosphate reductase
LTGKATRLYPLPPREIPAGSIYEDLELPPAGRREASRPYVIINMISTLDGKTTAGGKSSHLGSAVDRRVMRTLRSKAHAVLICANTLRAERLSLGLDEPVRDSQPLAVVLTTSGDLPLKRNLILGEGQELVVLVPEGITVPFARERGWQVRTVRAGGAGSIVLQEALGMLNAEHAVDLLLVEGGPSLNHSLMADNLVDEIFLTLTPKLFGGTAEEALTILEGPPLATREASLFSAHLSAGELFLRYGVR